MFRFGFHRGLTHLSSVPLLMALACGDDASGADDGTDGARSRCIGDAIPAFDMSDAESCILQGGDWSTDTVQCLGSGDTCGVLADRGLCVDLAGCGWQTPSGVERHPREGGTCEGLPAACDLLGVEDCRRQANCETDGARCTRRTSFFYLNTTDCEGIADAMTTRSIHPQVAYEACTARFGCVWVDGDGSREPGLGGATPAVPDCSIAPGEYVVERRATADGSCEESTRTLTVLDGDGPEALLYPDGCPSGCTCDLGFADPSRGVVIDGFDPGDACRLAGRIRCREPSASLLLGDYYLQGDENEFLFTEDFIYASGSSACLGLVTPAR